MPLNSPLNELPQPSSNPPEGVFPETPSVLLCSWNECLSGHRWPATMVVAPCPGCSGSFLAVKKENCPYCNEPAVKMSLRTDHLPRGAGNVPRCKGVTPYGESMDITLERNDWKQAETESRLFKTRPKIRNRTQNETNSGR